MEQLKRVFESIEANETNYDKRYQLVMSAMHYAGELGYSNYIRFDPETPGWPVFCIVLPGAGEVSWHMPSTQRDYTGYSTKEKYERIHKWLKDVNKMTCYSCNRDMESLGLTGKDACFYSYGSSKLKFCVNCFDEFNSILLKYSKVISDLREEKD